MMQLISSDNDTEQLLKGSLILEDEKNAHKRKHFMFETTVMHLANYLQEVERKWDSDERFDKPEDAIRYLDAAKWLLKTLDRDINRIEPIQKWLDNHLPFD